MPTLRPAQSEAVKVLFPESKLLLADVGAGKTATACRAIRARTMLYGRRRVLVIGTKRICESVWGDEIAKWTPEFAYANAAGLHADKRVSLMFDRSIDIVGLNFDNLIWAVSYFGAKLAELFPWVVIDESSKLENPKSKTFQAFKPLLPLFEWRLPMTGTPRANHLYDLWGSAYLADGGEALGKYREAFIQNWFFPVKRPGGIVYLPKANAEQEIYARLVDVVHRMPFDSTKPIEIDVLLSCNPTVKALQAEITKRLRDGDADVVINGITYTRAGKRSHVKELQLSSGFVYDDVKNVTHLHDDKINALKEIMAEAKGEPVMVVYQFDHERDAIIRAFPQARTMDKVTLQEWNQGDIEMLLVHPLSCGHGLNAQFSGSDLQVWFTPTSDAELYTQTIGRMNRPGAAKAIRVMRLIMKGTKDLACYMVVAARQRGEAATLEMFE